MSPYRTPGEVAADPVGEGMARFDRGLHVALGVLCGVLLGGATVLFFPPPKVDRNATPACRDHVENTKGVSYSCSHPSHEMTSFSLDGVTVCRCKR